MAMMSPGVEVNEIDMSIVVPRLGNATACFAGEFVKGPTEMFLLITNVDELIQYYGKPTNDNYNDWFQCYNFLQYSNKLLVSRAVDANGTFSLLDNTVKSVTEVGKVEITLNPERDNGSGTPVDFLRPGSVIKFDENAQDDYKIKEIETPVDSSSQVTEITVTADLATDDIIAITVNDLESSYSSARGDTASEAAYQLASLINSGENDVTATNNDAVIKITETTPGVETTFSAITGVLSVPNVITTAQSGVNYVLAFYENTFDFSTVASENSPIYLKASTLNAMAEIPVEGASIIARNGDDIKPLARYIANESVYELIETSISTDSTAKLTFFAKSPGKEMNGIFIAIAREEDFKSGKSEVFDGTNLNDFFEVAPLESKKEVAVIIKEDSLIKGTYIVSLIPGSKDYRNKSNYIEDVINKYDELLYVKDNTTLDLMPQTRMFKSVRIDSNGIETVILDQPFVITSNGANGFVNQGDIVDALGNVSDNTIFGKIANESTSLSLYSVAA